MKVFSGVPDFRRAEDAVEKFNEIYDGPEYAPFNEYVQFSRFVQSLFISDNGYVIDTGNFETVNRVIMKGILEKVRKHPFLWRMFMYC